MSKDVDGNITEGRAAEGEDTPRWLYDWYEVKHIPAVELAAEIMPTRRELGIARESECECCCLQELWRF